MTLRTHFTLFSSSCLLSSHLFLCSDAFTGRTAQLTRSQQTFTNHHLISNNNHKPFHYIPTPVFSSSDDDNEAALTTRESDELVLGIGGTGAALVMLYSEFVLSQTGCGLPAGPFGVVGAVEGISYLTVVGLGGYSIFKKVTTGSGLPAGKFGLLGLTEGLAFLALFAGVIVLALQITNFGYIPNAVPMEGGMCQ